MRILLTDVARTADVTPVTTAAWIEKLEEKKKFQKKSVGRGFTAKEAKRLCELLDLDYQVMLEYRELRIKQVSKIRKKLISLGKT